MATKTERSSLLNQGIDLIGEELTVGTLKKLLSYYPDNAKVLLNNLGADYIPTVGITRATGVNATERAKEHVYVMEAEGPINAVVLGFYDEELVDVEWPKYEAELDATQQAELDAVVAEMTKRFERPTTA